jgi:hypothetical protein
MDESSIADRLDLRKKLGSHAANGIRPERAALGQRRE